MKLWQDKSLAADAIDLATVRMTIVMMIMMAIAVVMVMMGATDSNACLSELRACLTSGTICHCVNRDWR